MDHVEEDEVLIVAVFSYLDCFSMEGVVASVVVEEEVWQVEMVAVEVVYHQMKALVVLEVVAAAFFVEAVAFVVVVLVAVVEEFHLQDCQSWSPHWDLKVYQAP